MADAQYAHGAVKLNFSEPPRLTALCHCFACQRRTGSPFSANAFYDTGAVSVEGETKEFVHMADSGRKVRMHFCLACGSTIFWKAEASPTWIGVGVGFLADPSFTASTVSVFEKSKHDWVRLEESMAHQETLP